MASSNIDADLYKLCMSVTAKRPRTVIMQQVFLELNERVAGNPVGFREPVWLGVA